MILHPSDSIERIHGDSLATQRLRARILQAASVDGNVLIYGPPGSGKKLVAQVIHELSPRATYPLIPVNCCTLRGPFFTSQVFGQVKQLEQGGSRSTLGCLRAADGGTVFFQNIHQLDEKLQRKLAAVARTGLVNSAGQTDWLPLDIRWIASSTHNLEQLVIAGEFRRDLWEHLNVISMGVPPLRERIDDIPALADHFLIEFSRRNGRRQPAISDAAVRLLQACPWPGNVRELRSVVERAAEAADDYVLDVDFIADLLENESRPSYGY